MGAIFDSRWQYAFWCKRFRDQHRPSIEFLELYAVTSAILSWARLLKNRRVIIFCDNEFIVLVINPSSSVCKNCMTLVRIITLTSLHNNVRFFCKHARGKNNNYADLLSRGKLKQFHELADMESKTFDPNSTKIPNCIWPLEKIWKQ